MEEGYEVIGNASFSAPYTPLLLAVDTAYKHSASLVLTDIRFKEEKQYTSIIYLPSYSTTYHHGNVAGTTYNGTSNTMTVNAVPIQSTVNIYTHDVLFFKKVNMLEQYGVFWHIPKRLPTEPVDAPVVVHILAVVHGSRAEADGLRRGQRLKSINGTPIINRQDIAPYLNNRIHIETVEVENEN